MNFALRRKRDTQFQRAADGSMTLLEHLRELRSRLFKASLGIAAGFGIGWWFSSPTLNLMERPYCELTQKPGQACNFLALGVTDPLALQMKVALYLALIVSAPIWLYQLWAFIAPGLHRNERRWAYWFAGVATPLFAFGAVAAYFVVAKGIKFLLQFGGPHIAVSLEITRYIGFITNMVLLFGLAFEFPLVVVLFNMAGLASAKRLLGWWRIAVFLFFLFSAIAVPTADPFGMSVLGLCLTALYFGAVLFSYINDKRRDRKNRALYGNVGDDEISPLNFDDSESVEAGSSVGAPEPVAPPRPLERRYDDMT
ncbi:MAG: sec-independent protein translocase protein TatC [Micromonosporaceae bacterium]